MNVGREVPNRRIDRNRLPFSADAEASVLGGILLRPEVADEVHFLDPESFFDPRHKHVFRAMRELRAKSKPIDIVLLEDQIRAADRLEAIGGASFLGDLVSRVATAANIGHYAEVVRDKAALRAMAEAAADVLAGVYSDPGDAAEFLAEAEQKIFAASQSSVADTVVPLKKALHEALKNIDGRMDDKAPGVPSGWTDLDALIGGGRPGDLIIFAGRPGSGKTSAGMGWIEYAATLDHPGLVFSKEMARAQLAERMLSSAASIDNRELRYGARGQVATQLAAAFSRLVKLPIDIDDLSNQPITALQAKARRWRAKNRSKQAVILVDYLQLVRGYPGKKYAGEGDEASDVSKGLKQMAKDNHCPVIALAQLNRECEKRQDKRPILSDIRATGQIEQDADVIAFAYRAEMYDKETPDKGIAEIIVAKQRNGATETVKLAWEGRYTRFSNLSRRHEGDGSGWGNA